MKKKIILAICFLLTCVLLSACSSDISGGNSEALEAAQESVKTAYIAAVKSEATNVVLLSIEENQGENDIWDTENHIRYTKFKVLANITKNAVIKITKIIHVESLGSDICETATGNNKYSITAYISVTESISSVTPPENNPSEQTAFISAVKSNAINRILLSTEENQGENDIWDVETHIRYTEFQVLAEITNQNEINIKSIVHVNKLGTDVCQIESDLGNVKYTITAFVSVDKWTHLSTDDSAERKAYISAVKCAAQLMLLSGYTSGVQPDESILHDVYEAKAKIMSSGAIEWGDIKKAQRGEDKCEPINDGSMARYNVTVYVTLNDYFGRI